MTMQQLPSGLWVPHNYYTISNQIIDGDADYFTHIIESPAGGTLTQVAFGVQTVTVGDDTFSVRLETIDADTGNPTGTLIDSPTNAAYGTVDIADADDNKMIICDINGGTGVTVTAGQKIAVRLARTASSSANLRPSYNTAFPNGAVNGYPYSTYDLSAGSWTKVLASPSLALNIGGWKLPVGCTALPSYATLTADNPGTPEQYGNIVNEPYKRRAMGAFAYLIGGAANAFHFKLYSDPLGTPTEIATTAEHDADLGTSAASARQTALRFASPVVLEPNTNYGLVISPNVSGTNVTIYYFTILHSSLSALWPMGANSYYCSRTDTGAFATDNTRFTMIGLILDQLDDGVGAGRPEFKGANL